MFSKYQQEKAAAAAACKEDDGADEYCEYGTSEDIIVDSSSDDEEAGDPHNELFGFDDAAEGLAGLAQSAAKFVGKVVTFAFSLDVDVRLTTEYTLSDTIKYHKGGELAKTGGDRRFRAVNNLNPTGVKGAISYLLTPKIKPIVSRQKIPQPKIPQPKTPQQTIPQPLRVVIAWSVHPRIDVTTADVVAVLIMTPPIEESHLREIISLVSDGKKVGKGALGGKVKTGDLALYGEGILMKAVKCQSGDVIVEGNLDSVAEKKFGGLQQQKKEIVFKIKRKR